MLCQDLVRILRVDDIGKSKTIDDWMIVHFHEGREKKLSDDLPKDGRETPQTVRYEGMCDADMLKKTVIYVS